jgi:hypothetical protein
MKATLEFNLPDDYHEWDMAVHGAKMYLAMHEFSQELRIMWKYKEYQTDEEYAILESIRDKFHEILTEHNITLK